MLRLRSQRPWYAFQKVFGCACRGEENKNSTADVLFWPIYKLARRPGTNCINFVYLLDHRNCQISFVVGIINFKCFLNCMIFLNDFK